MKFVVNKTILQSKMFLISVLTTLICFSQLFPSLSFDSPMSNFSKASSSTKFYYTPASLNINAGFDNGFTIPAGQNIYLQSAFPISGTLDLSGTLSLATDLYLGSKFSYQSTSSVGRLDANGKAVHLGGNLSIPAFKVLHIYSDTIIEGCGNTINLGDSAQIFVDDNVTLTLRNLVISSSKNFAGNPAIKLASNRSELALDNVTLDVTGDFYFDCGQLFIHNDVAFTGTSAFIYQSTAPSFITSGGRFYFDVKTTLDFRPGTTGTPQLLAKDLLMMQDASSGLYLNGCTLKTTLTGMRLTKGRVLFDNKVSMTSQAAQVINPNTTTGGLLNSFSGYTYLGGTAAPPSAINWSPDGRYVVVSGGTKIKTYAFTKTGTCGGLAPVGGSWGAAQTTNGIKSAWSPDGKFIACGSSIFSFTGSASDRGGISSTVVATIPNTATSLAWRPDGRYLVIGTTISSIGYLQLYEFTNSGRSLVMISSGPLWGTDNCNMNSVAWSRDGKIFAVGVYDITGGGGRIRTIKFENGKTSGTGTYELFGGDIQAVEWSPDGRYLVAGCTDTNACAKVFRYSGTNTGVASVGSGEYTFSTGGYVFSTSWSSDGRYVVVSSGVIGSSGYLGILKVTGTGTTGGLQAVGTGSISASNRIASKLSPDSKYVAAMVVGYPTANESSIKIYAVDWRPETQTQNITNAIVFGNAARGSSYDLNVRMLAGAQAQVGGLLNYDCVN